MIPIIDPIDKDLLKSELNENTFLRVTNHAENLIYVVNNRNSPNVLREIGRLREVSFRSVGGGSGKDCDLDHFDLEDDACHQLIVWNPETEEIIGGYRFTLWKDATFFENGQPYVNTEHLFTFSEKFLKDYFPYCIEMARAFVQPKYQTAQMGRKSLFALDNLWDGIGGLIVKYDYVKYLAGKVTIYSVSPDMSRKAMIYFLEKFYGCKEQLLVGKWAETFTSEESEFFDKMFCDESVKENYKILVSYVKSLGDNVPPLIHSYTELSSSMRTFGTVCDPDFGDGYDTAMIITIDDTYPQKKKRYIQSFIDTK